MATKPVMNEAAMATIPGMQHMLEESVAAETATLKAHVETAQAARNPPVTTLAARPVDITGEIFLQHMQGMQQHYTAGSVAPKLMYALPAHLMPAHAPAIAHPVPATAGAKAVDTALQRIHAETLAVVKGHADALAAAAQHAEAAKMTTAQFTAYMNTLRERDKQNAAAQLNRLYASLSALGNAHPDQRARILQTTNHSGNFLSALQAEMQQISHTVEGKITAALHAVVSPVRAAVETAGHWASGAVKSVGNFFSHLF